MSNKKHLPQQSHTAVRVQQTYSGPIPQADQMAQYASIDPSFPQKIISMAIKEQDHRIEKEKKEQLRADKIVASNSFLATCGVFSAVICVFIIMTAAVLCACFGQPLPASIIGGGGLVMIVTVLVKGSRLNPNK